MTLAPDANRKNGAKHRIEIPISTTGVFVFSVSRGRRLALSVENPGGSTIDLIHFNFSEDEDKQDGITRMKVVDETGLTATQISRFTAIGVDQAGIEITIATASTVILELTESNL